MKEPGKQSSKESKGFTGRGIYTEPVGKASFQKSKDQDLTPGRSLLMWVSRQLVASCIPWKPKIMFKYLQWLIWFGMRKQWFFDIRTVKPRTWFASSECLFRAMSRQRGHSHPGHWTFANCKRKGPKDSPHLIDASIHTGVGSLDVYYRTRVWRSQTCKWSTG